MTVSEYWFKKDSSFALYPSERVHWPENAQLDWSISTQGWSWTPDTDEHSSKKAYLKTIKGAFKAWFGLK